MTVSLNILRFPSFQSCAMLPDNIKMKYKNELQQWYDAAVANKYLDLDPTGKPLYNAWELSQVERLIDYLDVVKTPHAFTADTSKLYNDFKQFYLQYDRRRGKNFRETFPQEYVDFINSIPGDDPLAGAPRQQEEVSVPKLIPDEIMHDIKTGGGYISDELKNDST